MSSELTSLMKKEPLMAPHKIATTGYGKDYPSYLEHYNLYVQALAGLKTAWKAARREADEVGAQQPGPDKKDAELKAIGRRARNKRKREKRAERRKVAALKRVKMATRLEQAHTKLATTRLDRVKKSLRVVAASEETLKKKKVKTEEGHVVSEKLVKVEVNRPTPISIIPSTLRPMTYAEMVKGACVLNMPTSFVDSEGEKIKRARTRVTADGHLAIRHGEGGDEVLTEYGWAAPTKRSMKRAIKAKPTSPSG
jgi:hypothetical protein